MMNRRQGGSGQGGGFGGKGSPGQGTTTSSQAGPTISSSASSGSNKGAIIGGIVGGIAGLLILSLLGVWLLNRRKQRQIREGKTQPVTYTGLNAVFRGTPFNRSPHSSQAPLPLFHPSTNTSYSSAASVGHRDSGHETDHMLPTYAESQSSVQLAGQGSPAHLNTSYYAGSDSIVSPLSARDPNEPHVISPQTTGATYLQPQQTETTNIVSPQSTGAANMTSQRTRVPPEAETLTPDITGLTYLDSEYTASELQSPSATFLTPLHTRDTMGFPVEDTFSEIRLHPETPTPIVSPVPRHPLVHQDSLERVVRQGMSETPTPVSGNRNPDRLRVLSQEMPRESPVLGGLNPVRMVNQPAESEGVGLNRNLSQRTVATVSSRMSVVSDGELERLGVGSRRNHL